MGKSSESILCHGSEGSRTVSIDTYRLHCLNSSPKFVWAIPERGWQAIAEGFKVGKLAKFTKGTVDPVWQISTSNQVQNSVVELTAFMIIRYTHVSLLSKCRTEMSD